MIFGPSGRDPDSQNPCHLSLETTEVLQKNESFKQANVFGNLKILELIYLKVLEKAGADKSWRSFP